MIIKNIKRVLMLLAFCISASSCKKFLDVKPQDRILENGIFSSEQNINTALNGIYLDIAKPALYGGNLTMSTIDILGQCYNCAGQHNKVQYAGYKYSDAGVMGTMDTIWTGGYRNILNVNNFIQQMEISQGVISAAHKDILLGEAYAMRGFLHFDLLRLYGPVYKKDSLLKAIPYLMSTNVDQRPLLPANQVMEMIIRDLAKASGLLQQDPVKTEGITTLTGEALSDFYRLRNRRLNYFAVKALMARVQLYRGNKNAAYVAAAEVINAASRFFPWTDPEKVVSDPANPDRIFSSEVLFGVQNAAQYNQQRQLFSSTLQPSVILAPLTAQLSNIFEGNVKDYRFDPSWKVPSTGGKAYRTFFKFDDIQNTKLTFRMFQPLIRISEVYYIAAETAPDASTAVNYLNAVRHNRGLADLAVNAVLQAEIQKEYRREFFGEGQLFFYYKRQGLTAIPNGSSNSNLNMDLKNYSVPLPLSETQNR